MLKTRLCVALLLVLGGLVTAAPAAQARFQIAIQDDPVFLYQNIGVAGGRDQAYVQAKRLHVSAIRFNFIWADWVHTGRNFAMWDSAVNAARAHGVQPFFTIVGTPAYIKRCGSSVRPTMCPGDYQLSYRRHPLGLWRSWVRTIARHFKGRVRMYTIWNEPNLGRYLNPSRTAPREYRKLYTAAYSAIKGIDRHAKVFIGETTSALSRGGYLPTTFIKAVANRGHLYADGFSHHPFQFDNRAPGQRDTHYEGISNFPKINATLRMLARRHRLTTPTGGALHIYGTEFGYLACGYKPQPEPVRARWAPLAFKYAKRTGALGFTWYELYRYPGECQLPASRQPWDSGLLSVLNQPTPTYLALLRVLPRL